MHSIFGSEAVVGLLSQIPEWLQTGINISGGIIPALGFAMLAQMIMDKKRLLHSSSLVSSQFNI